MLSRFARLVLIVGLCIIVPALYVFYPSASSSEKNPHKPTDPYDGYEAGGIDSEHYRAPVKPDFEVEEARWNRHDGFSEAIDDGEDADQTVCVDLDCSDQTHRGKISQHAHDGSSSSDKHAVDGHAADRLAGGKGPWRLDAHEKGSDSRGKGFVLEGEEVDTVLGGGVIMPKLANETAKAELGRAAWRVLHLMTLRFPEKPTPDDRAALKSYMHLFSRLYPCGECATEFQALLKQYPPQTSSRKSASLWLCHVHNMVNERLGKPEFDCLTLDETYDCGCGDDPVDGVKTGSAGSKGDKASSRSGSGDNSASAREAKEAKADSGQSHVVHDEFDNSDPLD